MPSSHGPGRVPVTRQTPAPSQVVASVHTLPSSQGAPAASKVQVAEQQSPASVLPSSQVSPRLASTKPSPQKCACRPMSENWSVMTTPPGMPGPSTLKKLVPHEPPVTAWRIAGLPMYPAGAEAGGSQVRKWLMRAVVSSARSARTLVNRSPVAMAQEGTITPPTTVCRQSSVKLMARMPAVAARSAAVTSKVSTPYGWVTV